MALVPQYLLINSLKWGGPFTRFTKWQLHLALCSVKAHLPPSCPGLLIGASPVLPSPGLRGEKPLAYVEYPLRDTEMPTPGPR